MQPVVELRPSPKFTNAAKLLADPDCDEKLRYVRVLNKTANITNGKVLIRRFVDLPDGMYNVNLDGSLSPTQYPHGMTYPDIELVRPPLSAMKAACNLNRDTIGAIIHLCNEVAQRNGSVIINNNAIFCEQNREVGFQYPFNLEAPIRLQPKHLGMVMVEMAQYPEVKMLREYREVASGDILRTPIVIGRDWGSCALISPLVGYHGPHI